MAVKQNKSKSSAQPGGRTIPIKSHTIVRNLVLFLVLLVVLSLTGQYLRFYTTYEEAWGLIPLVNMGLALSIPTIYQVLLLALAAILLAIIAAIQSRKGDVFRKHWIALAIAFIFLSLNEGSSVDMLVSLPIRNFLRDLLPGWRINRWYLTSAFSLAVLLLFYREFFKALPKHTRKWMLIALVLYLAGFTAFRMAKTVFLDYYEEATFMYAILRAAGKSFEISGAIAFIYSLLEYIKQKFPIFSVDIGKSTAVK